MGWEFFGRPKIFSQKFLSRSARQRLAGTLWAPFCILRRKSIQNGCCGNGQHFRYRRWVIKSLKNRKIALLVKEKGRIDGRNIHQSCRNMHKGWFFRVVVLKRHLNGFVARMGKTLAKWLFPFFKGFKSRTLLLLWIISIISDSSVRFYLSIADIRDVTLAFSTFSKISSLVAHFGSDNLTDALCVCLQITLWLTAHRVCFPIWGKKSNQSLYLEKIGPKETIGLKIVRS